MENKPSPEHEFAYQLIEQFHKLPFIKDRYEQAPDCALVSVEEHIKHLNKELAFYKKVRTIIKSKKVKHES